MEFPSLRGLAGTSESGTWVCRTLETHVQYKRNPARCQFTTALGVTKTRGFLHPDQHVHNATQNSLCGAAEKTESSFAPSHSFRRCTTFWRGTARPACQHGCRGLLLFFAVLFLVQERAVPLSSHFSKNTVRRSHASEGHVAFEDGERAGQHRCAKLAGEVCWVFRIAGKRPEVLHWAGSRPGQVKTCRRKRVPGPQEKGIVHHRDFPHARPRCVSIHHQRVV